MNCPLTQNLGTNPDDHPLDAELRDAVRALTETQDPD
jgi:hypothetical protein